MQSLVNDISLWWDHIGSNLQNKMKNHYSVKIITFGLAQSFQMKLLLLYKEFKKHTRDY
jgi:hypothetical protein